MFAPVGVGTRQFRLCATVPAPPKPPALLFAAMRVVVMAPPLF
jgi:hypothetical protein